MKILSIVGARPQFIKAASVSRKLRSQCREVLVHTGQHYNYGMSEVFFRELDIPEPDYNLAVGSGTHGSQTGKMMIKIEEVQLAENPDIVMVYGDTNSTIAGALCAAKLHIPLAHVEAGLRSFNKLMPEEINRIITDHCSDLLFCPTPTAVENLNRENIHQGVHLVGDVMYDSLLYNTKIAEKSSKILDTLSISPGEYILATIHRAENTDDEIRLSSIISALYESGKKTILPIHPRTRKFIHIWGIEGILSKSSNILVIDPISYLDMLMLEKNALLIMTDSGGIQKEAYLFRVPCITLREETEWIETVKYGGNILVGAHKEKILAALEDFRLECKVLPEVYGDGNAAGKIVELLMSLKT